MAPNWVNRTIWTGDNLPIMRGMNSESIDLIYLDPPFNSKANYAAPIGSKAAGAEFKDTWTLTDIDEAWLYLLANKVKQQPLWRVIQAASRASNKSYLIYMAVRLLEMRRILRPTGSIWLHCDPTLSHYLKLLMDAIFGERNFRNEVVWCYKGPSNAKKWFARKHDTLFFYGKTQETPFYPDSVRIPYSEQFFTRRKYTEGESGITGGYSTGRDTAQIQLRFGLGKVPEDWWIGIGAGGHIPRTERTGYPTQKPIILLERIVNASSAEGDVVFDPFCGCATTLVAADRLNRNWLGIDISDIAVQLVKERVKRDQGLFNDIVHRTDNPKRTDLGPIQLYNSLANKKLLYGEQGGNCNGCDKHFEMINFHVDHIIATKVGGTDHIDNLQLLCGYCNSVKGDRGMEYLKVRLGLKTC